MLRGQFRIDCVLHSCHWKDLKVDCDVGKLRKFRCNWIFLIDLRFASIGWQQFFRQNYSNDREIVPSPMRLMRVVWSVGWVKNIGWCLHSVL